MSGGVWVKNGEAWQQVNKADISARVSGEWKPLTDGWAKRDGVWRPIWKKTVVEDWEGSFRGFWNPHGYPYYYDKWGYYGCWYPGYWGWHDWYDNTKYYVHHHCAVGWGGYSWWWHDNTYRWGGYWGCPHDHRYHHTRPFAQFPQGSLGGLSLQSTLEGQTITSMSIKVGLESTQIHKWLGDGYPTYMTVWALDGPPTQENDYGNRIECLGKIAWYGSQTDEDNGWTVVGESELGTNPGQRGDRYPVSTWIDVDPSLFSYFTLPPNENPLTMIGLQAYYWPLHAHPYVWKGDDYTFHAKYYHLYHWRYHCRPTVTVRVEHT